MVGGQHLAFFWSVVHFYFQQWSLSESGYGLSLMVGGLWSVVLYYAISN